MYRSHDLLPRLASRRNYCRLISPGDGSYGPRSLSLRSPEPAGPLYVLPIFDLRNKTTSLPLAAVAYIILPRPSHDGFCMCDFPVDSLTDFLDAVFARPSASPRRIGSTVTRADLSVTHCSLSCQGYELRSSATPGSLALWCSRNCLTV